MHILYLHQYFVPPDGSGGTRSYEFARRFVKDGHKVTIITTNAFMPKHFIIAGHGDTELDGITIKVLDIPYSNKYHFAKRMLAFIRYICQTVIASLRMKDVDVVFATSTPLTIAIPAIAAKAWHNCAMIFEVRDLWPELPVAIGAIRNPVLIRAAGWLEKLAYRWSDYIIALSPGMKEGIVKQGYPHDRIAVIPNSADIELFRISEEAGTQFRSSLPNIHDEPLIIYAGTLGLINGADYLVEIAAAMARIDPTIRFLIVGDGRQREMIIKKAKELQVLDSTLWILPPLLKKDMPKLLSACTVATSLFVDLPEMWNNSANKFFDALAAGKPVMINHRGWQADLLNKSGAGLVVPPNDPKKAAKLLHDFINDKDKVQKARQASRYLAENDFNRDKLFEQLLAVFLEVLKSKKVVKNREAQH